MASEAGLREWRRLHPASVVVNLVPRAARVVRTSWPVLFALVWGEATDFAGLIDLGILLFFFLMTVGSTVVHFLTLRYRLRDGRLELRTGLLRRQVRVFDSARIQNVELIRNVFHRLSGLVEVRLETASGTEVEGLLSALRREDGEELVEALRPRVAVVAAEAPAPEVLVRSTWVDHVRWGATAVRLGASLVLFGLVTEFLPRALPVDLGSGTVRVGLLATAVVSASLLSGVATAALRWWGFQLTVQGDALVAEGGLLTRRRIELGRGKVQVAMVSAPVLRRLAGFATLRLETAAARQERGGVVTAVAVAPVVDAEELDAVVRRAIPEVDVSVLARDLEPPHRHALVRSVILAVMRAAVAVGLALWWFGAWGAVAGVLLPVWVGLAWLDYRSQGWRVTEHVVIARSGWWHRRVAVVARAKLQAAHASQGLMRRRWGLARVAVRVAGTTVALPDMSWERAGATVRELSRLPG